MSELLIRNLTTFVKLADITLGTTNFGSEATNTKQQLSTLTDYVLPVNLTDLMLTLNVQLNAPTVTYSNFTFGLIDKNVKNASNFPVIYSAQRLLFDSGTPASGSTNNDLTLYVGPNAEKILTLTQPNSPIAYYSAGISPQGFILPQPIYISSILPTLFTPFFSFSTSGNFIGDGGTINIAYSLYSIDI